MAAALREAGLKAAPAVVQEVAPAAGVLVPAAKPAALGTPNKKPTKSPIASATPASNMETAKIFPNGLWYPEKIMIMITPMIIANA